MVRLQRNARCDHIITVTPFACTYILSKKSKFSGIGGVWVGRKVGGLDGIELGVLLGSTEGCALGTLEGTSLGARLGNADGRKLMVGGLDGAVLGVTEGAKVLTMTFTSNDDVDRLLSFFLLYKIAAAVAATRAATTAKLTTARIAFTRREIIVYLARIAYF